MQAKTLFISRLSLLVALTLVIQMGGLPQPITGPLVNAMLLITTNLLGWVSGVILGCITPVVALLRGQLPPVLAPMAPFIAIGNALFVLFYFILSAKIKFLKRKRLNPIARIEVYSAIIVAAVIKFLFLSISVRIILPILIAHLIPDKLVIMMTTPQLLTALIGGAIALIISEILYQAGIWYQRN